MTDDRRPEDRLVDEVLRPKEDLGEKRQDHASRRRPSSRKGGSGQKKRKPRLGMFRTSLWIIFLAFLAVGGYFGWQWFGPQLAGEEDPFPVDGDVVEAPPLAGDRAVVVVFPEWDASGYVTEERQIPSRDRGGEDLLGIMKVLCRGPVVSGAVSPFPRGTRATAAFYNPDDRSVVVDFSEELVTGHPGGSSAEVATLTAILRTVALNFPETRSCTILVGGSQVETLAGHLTLDRPFDPRRWL